jgi:hypothetical protein
VAAKPDRRCRRIDAFDDQAFSFRVDQGFSVESLRKAHRALLGKGKIVNASDPDGFAAWDPSKNIE